jgi:hypothetical protein
VPLALLAQEEGELQPALEVAGVDRTPVGAHRAGQVAEVLEHLAQVAPGVGLAAGHRDLVGLDGFGVALLGDEGVAEVERSDRVAEVGGTAEAPLGVDLAVLVGEVAAQVDQGVDVIGPLERLQARVEVLGHAVDLGGRNAPPRLPSG